MLELYPYQKQGVDFLVSHKGGLLADEQGLGKTIQALESCNYFNTKVVIICPAIMRETWKYEAEKVLNEKSSVIRKDEDHIKWRNEDRRILIYSYDFVSSHLNVVLQWVSRQKAVTIILDESHYIKTPVAKRTKAVLKLLENKNIINRILLTGTPVTRDIDDLYIPMKIFLGDFAERKNIWQFRKAYMMDCSDYFGKKYKGFKSDVAKNYLIQDLKKFCIRRTKSKVLKELPSITRKKIFLDVSKKVAEESMKLLDYALAYINQDHTSYNLYKKELEENNIHVSTIRRALGIAKAPQILDFIKHLNESGVKKVVLFCVHTELINLLEKSLTTKFKDLKVSKIIGGTSDKQRQDIIQDFQKDDNDKHIIISNVLAGGVGITLTKSNVVVFGEIDWTPANLMQAEARVHRITQDKQVVSYYLVAKNSIDDRILDVLKTKMKIIKEIM